MIKIENIGKVFNAHSRNRNEVLKGVSFELPEKGFIAIYGKSGSGKTTLLNIIGGLDRQDSGKIYIDGENVAGKVDKIRNAKIGFIFQNYYLERGYTIAEIMKMPCTSRALRTKPRSNGGAKKSSRSWTWSGSRTNRVTRFPADRNSG